MTTVNIRIATLDDKEPTFPECTSENTIIGTLYGFSIIEGGTTSGKTSVAIIIKGNGGYFMAEATADMFNTMHGALKGAEQRFNDLRTQNG